MSSKVFVFQTVPSTKMAAITSNSPLQPLLEASTALNDLFQVCGVFLADPSTVILQSHYPNRRSADGRRAKFWKIGRRRSIVGRHRHRFWLIFWSADDFFVEAPKLKVSLTDPPIFIGFVIGEASGDDRPMIGRQSADVWKKFSS